MKNVINVSLVLVAILSSACAGGYYKSQSSGQIGCAEDDIDIVDTSTGLGGKTWVAECKGKKFYCSSTNSMVGTTSVSCKQGS